jgi:hypothetical protein
VECLCYNLSQPDRNKPTEMSNLLGYKCYHVHLLSVYYGLRRLVCPLLRPSAPLVVLVIIDPCHFGFASDFKRFLHPFWRAVVVKADPILKLVSDCKFSLTEGTIPTWKLRKWSRLPSCRWNQEVVHITILCFLTNLSSFVNLETRFLEGVRVVTPLVYCSCYNTSAIASTVVVQWLLQ